MNFTRSSIIIFCFSLVFYLVYTCMLLALKLFFTLFFQILALITLSFVGLGLYGQRPIRYVIDTYLADTIRIRYIPYRYDTYSIHTLPIRYVFDTIHQARFWAVFKVTHFSMVRWHAPPQFILLHWRRGILGTL